jgi:exodeoxyribonuclease III
MGRFQLQAAVALRIATFNVNGINGRLAVLLEWLKQARPDIACLHELKAETGRRSPNRGIL